MRRRSLATLIFGLTLGCGGAGEGGDGTGTEAGTPADLPPEIEPLTTVAETLVPCDVNREDLVGPGSWATNYGKSPELIAVPDGAGGLAILAHDYTDLEQPGAWLLHLQPSVDDFVITAAFEPPMLDRIMGLVIDDDGEPIIASGIVEDLHQPLTTEYPAPGEYRSGVVRVVALDWAGGVDYDIDLDLAREAFDEPELLINPMVAATSRMAHGAGMIALVHGINTDPDDAEVRHQKAISTQLDARTGTVLRTSSIWVSHSFDQRVWHDGQGFVEAHLGDAYPRHIAFARVNPGASSGEYPLFHIKGPTGDNVTRSLLGDVAPIDEDPSYGFIALFVSERSEGTEALDPMHGNIAGARELAMVRIRRDFETVTDEAKQALDHLDPALPDTLSVESGETMRTNRVRWLTDYAAEGQGSVHAERPKLVAIGGDRYIALWEKWELADADATFAGTWAVALDAEGTILAGPEQVSIGHLPRGDDAFVIDGQAGWLTGDSQMRQLRLYLLDETLNLRKITIE